MVGDVQLLNSLEWVEWSDSPAQVVLCEACGVERCEPGGYAEIRRLGDFLLWGAPWIDDPDDATEFAPSYALRKAGPILVPREEWNRWGETVASLPAFEQFGRCRRRDLVWAWLNGSRVVSRSEALRFPEAIAALEASVVTTENLDAAEAMSRVKTIVAWAENHPLADVEETIDPWEGEVETLYSDGPGELDWPGLVVAPSLAMAFGPRWKIAPPTGLEDADA